MHLNKLFVQVYHLVQLFKSSSESELAAIYCDTISSTFGYSLYSSWLFTICYKSFAPPPIASLSNNSPGLFNYY